MGFTIWLDEAVSEGERLYFLESLRFLVDFSAYRQEKGIFHEKVTFITHSSFVNQFTPILSPLVAPFLRNGD